MSLKSGRGSSAGYDSAGASATSQMKLGRRSVLLGAGAAAIIPPLVKEDSLRLFYPDEARRDAVAIRYRGQLTTWYAEMFGERAWFKLARANTARYADADLAVPPLYPEALDWLPSRWELTVEDGSFPGGPLHTLVFRFERTAGKNPADVLGDWTVQVQAKNWPQTGRLMTLGPAPLDDFLGSGRIGTRLPVSAAQPLLEGWFGKRIETTDSVRLELDRDLRWHVVSPGRRLFILDLATPVTDSPFGFANLRVERSFPDGLAPGSTAGGAAKEDARLFAEFAPRRLAENSLSNPPRRGLYGSLSDPLDLDGTARTRFDLAATEGRAGILATLTLHKIGSMRGGLRHWGDPVLTVAGVVLEGEPEQRCATLTIRTAEQGTAKRPRAIEDSAFELSACQLVRQLAPDPERPGIMVEQSRASLTPRSKEHVVETPFGSVVVCAAPSVPLRSGKLARVPPITLASVDGPGKGPPRLLRRFEAVLSLISASVRVPPLAQPDRNALPRPDAEVIARLEFNSAECHFILPGVAPAFSEVATDAVVPLGPLLGPGERQGGEAFLDLGRARLTLLRSADLLSLTYRFSGLLLRLPRRNERVAARVLPNRGGPVCRGGSPADTHPVQDLRPLMVVEFPPQHVAERAYFRQLNLTVLPAFQVTKKQQPKLETLRCLARRRGQDPGGKARDERIKLRSELKSSGLEFKPLPKDFIAEFERRAATKEGTRRPLPMEQRIYLGSEFLDTAARRLAFQVLREADDAAAKTGLRPETIPDPAVPLPEQMEVLRPFSLVPKDLPGADPKSVFDPADSKQSEAALAMEHVKEKRDSDYAYFRTMFHIIARDFSVAPDLQEYLGATWFGSAKPRLPPGLLTFAAGFAAAREEPFETVTEARLSGPSRLAFRINCDDFQAERANGGFAFTIEGLTDWGSMDLAVVRRAERLIVPPDRGPWAPRWAQVYNLDDGAFLEHLGISKADHIAVEAARALRRGGLPSNKPAHVLPGSLIDPYLRLAEVAASARAEPDPFQTSIELPYRLMLSPAQDAIWRVPNAAVVAKAFASQAGEGGSAAPADPPYQELWSASLAGTGALAGVRAVWSPDFRPEALLSTRQPGAPLRGAWAPWSMPRSFGLRCPPSKTVADGMPRFRTAMDAYDRHEIVILSSVHGLPVLGKRDRDGTLLGGSQFEPPAGFALSGLEKNEPLAEKGGSPLPLADYSAIYRPQPLLVNELALTALGGNLDHDTPFVPPTSAVLAGVGKRAVNLFDALSIERWRNRTVLGRDISVEVVYKGFLFPIGHKAALVRLTERRFEASPAGGAPIAVLIQREFLRVGQPEKRFPAYGQANDKRRWPAEKVEMLTRRTPDLISREQDPEPIPLSDGKATGTGLAFWPRTVPRLGAEVLFEMRIDDEGGSGAMPLIFVDNTAAHDPDSMAALVRYYQTTPVSRRLPRNGQGVRMAPAAKTGDTTYVTEWWELLAEGRQTATPTPASSNTPQAAPPAVLALPTAPVRLDNSTFRVDPFMEGLDQPGFYPLVHVARVRLGQVERMTGRQTVWSEVQYDGTYVANGFPDEMSPVRDETFLRIAGDPVPMTMASGERSGGIAQPNTFVVGLSRAIGPVGSNIPPPPSALVAAAASTPQPPRPGPETLPTITAHSRSLNSGSIFPLDANLLGLVPLSKVLMLAANLADLPVLKEAVEYGASAAAGAGAAARNFITETVLRPIKGAVRQLYEQWDTLGDSNPLVKGSKLDEAYPQIGVALTRLETRLRASLSNEPRLADEAFFLSLRDLRGGADFGRGDRGGAARPAGQPL